MPAQNGEPWSSGPAHYFAAVSGTHQFTVGTEVPPVDRATRVSAGRIATPAAPGPDVGAVDLGQVAEFVHDAHDAAIDRCERLPKLIKVNSDEVSVVPGKLMSRTVRLGVQGEA